MLQLDELSVINHYYSHFLIYQNVNLSYVSELFKSYIQKLLEINISKVLLDDLKDQPTVKDVSNIDEECELKILISGKTTLLLVSITIYPRCAF